MILRGSGSRASLCILRVFLLSDLLSARTGYQPDQLPREVHGEQHRPESSRDHTKNPHHQGATYRFTGARFTNLAQ